MGLSQIFRYLPNSKRMKVLLKQARILSPLSPFHGHKKDISVVNGQIERIADNIDPEGFHVISSPHLHVSTGWVDLFADFGEPGNENRETIETGIQAAAAGGFTDVLLLPGTKPPVTTRSQVAYIKHRSENSAVSLHPIGGISKDLQGAELAEMYDMFEAGAIAFSDGLAPVQNAGLLLKALQYVLPLNANIIQLPVDKNLSKTGLMNEGVTSTKLGMPGKPVLAEELAVHRDLKLLAYTNSRLHLTGISTANSIQEITKAKQDTLRITYSVTPYHCWFHDETLTNYDTRFKVDPPIRTAEDRDAVRKAVIEGRVDCFASHHQPRDWDEKTCEFEYAKYGMEGLETAFAVYNNLGAPLDLIIAMLTDKPRSIFNLNQPKIEESVPACLTVFDPEIKWVASEKNLRSKSKNNGFLGLELKGKVLGIINNRQFLSNE